MNGIVVGLGFMGKTHLEAYAKIPHVRIFAIVDSSVEVAQSLSYKYHCKAFTNLKEALEQGSREGKLDFVDICLPSPLHKESAFLAMDQGLDVIIEKPLSVSLEEAKAILKKSKETARRVMVAHVCRFMSQYEYAKNTVESGRLGAPLFLGTWRQSELPGWSKDNWLHDRKQSGGTIMDLTIHDIDISNWLLGKPISFGATEVAHPKVSGCSHVVSSLRYERGAIASIEGGHLMPPGYPFLSGYRLVFEKGVIEWNTVNTKPGMVVEYIADGVSHIPLEEVDDNPYLNELQHFVSAIEGGTPFKIELEEAVLAVETVHNLVESLL